MTARFPFVLHASMLSLAIAGFAAEASAGQNVFSVSGSNVQINRSEEHTSELQSR
jgi:hypothetical protein